MKDYLKSRMFTKFFLNPNRNWRWPLNLIYWTYSEKCILYCSKGFAKSLYIPIHPLEVIFYCLFQIRMIFCIYYEMAKHNKTNIFSGIFSVNFILSCYLTYFQQPIIIFFLKFQHFYNFKTSINNELDGSSNIILKLVLTSLVVL
jgi:hypothetical protein